jgi:hypothetical protein
MRRSTAIYILVLVVLAGLYYYLNNRPQKEDGELSSSTPLAVEYLFDSSDGLPTRIQIKSKSGEVVEVARDAENAWVLTKPIEASADQGSVEAATSQIPTIRVLDSIPNLAKDAVGLDDPEYTFTIQFNDDVERMIDIGVLTPTGSGYYVSRGTGDILIVSNSALDALIEFLINPPYLATETPPPPPPEAGPSSETTTTPLP